MSGGHWNYNQYWMEEFLQEVGRDGNVRARFPKLAQVMDGFGRVLGEIAKDLDWDLSDDTAIQDDAQFEKDALAKIGEVLGKKLRVRVYEVEEDE